MAERLSYEESCEKLKPDYISETPALPARMPRYDDEELGVSFFRTFVGEAENLSGLTLPRTYIGRSELDDVSFRNTDLSESCFCWNEFSNVDFREADLSGADLRGSIYRNVRFDLADLRGADLRHSTFENCSFEGADMRGSILTRSQRKSLNLSPTQKKTVSWKWRQGPQPQGG